MHGTLMHPLNITISNGALCMDGGSVSLQATDPTGRMLHISLDWSIKAQRSSSTCLAIDGVKIQQGSKDEAKWMEVLQHAQIAGTGSVPTGEPSLGDRIASPANRIVMAPDANAYLKAIDRGPRSALMALRDDILQKLQSPCHKREPGAGLPASEGKPQQPGPPPLP